MLGTSNGDGRKSLAPTLQIVSGIDAYLELYLNLILVKLEPVMTVPPIMN